MRYVREKWLRMIVSRPSRGEVFEGEIFKGDVMMFPLMGLIVTKKIDLMVDFQINRYNYETNCVINDGND